ncbi:hypothetical protein D1157_00665 [Anaerotruncus sp. X29]|nr:hypothetical protein [Anaerotruncus sp. 1XD42-93]NCE73513.1 hypothetical protein [Anaerotruncus sp. X29]RKJ88816.1 hypothetical protein D7Y41_17675 [Anaerotruncus sp. 1XD22-93]
MWHFGVKTNAVGVVPARGALSSLPGGGPTVSSAPVSLRFRSRKADLSVSKNGGWRGRRTQAG